MSPKGLYILAFTLLISSLVFSISVWAQVNLRFRPAESFKEKQIIAAAEAENPQVPLLLAPVDLNDDAINEFIVKPQNPADCPQNPLCPHVIMAYSRDRPLEIGRFDAHKIEVSNKKTYGVRHIIVYNQPQNDFAQTTIIWNPFAFRY